MEQPGYTKPEAQKGLGLQLGIALVFGSFSLLLFSYSRRKLPHIYSARILGQQLNDPTMFGWIKRLIKFSDQEVLQSAGLDAYVYLTFFRFAFTVLLKLSVVSLCFLAPLRWYYIGHFDDDDDGSDSNNFLTNITPRTPNLFGDYTWVYLVATYVFTYLCLSTTRQFSDQVVKVRQAYLGSLNSITDKTLRISGVPHHLRDLNALSHYFSTIFKTKPENIVLCRDWSLLDELWEKRSKLLGLIERLYTVYLGYNAEEIIRRVNEEGSIVVSDAASTNGTSSTTGGAASGTSGSLLSQKLITMCPERVRPRGRTQLFGFFGPKVDLIDYYTHELSKLDYHIASERLKADEFPSKSMAFVTMASTAQCQLAAQSLLCPKAHQLVTSLAPSPSEIIWRNVYLSSNRRRLYTYVISLIVLLVSAFLVVPLTYISQFLDINIIKENFPELGEWLIQHKWMQALVTEVLPTYLFASFNLVIPYFYEWLTSKQGFVSKGDAELSTISKNFFYVFVNLFLIFTIESTFFSFSLDTKELAKEFAHWLLKLSSFYTNLIVLQGIGLAPTKLLQLGSLCKFMFNLFGVRTPREQYKLYTPEKINYGLMLPTPLFIFIVVLTYSIIRRRILLFGLIYFATTYVVFKYQLLYTMVHSQHSSAQLWTVIVRRVYLGIVVMHIAMMGVLVLQYEYVLAILILPLLVSLLGFFYDFEKYTKPLLEYVALDAFNHHEPLGHTIDEEREWNLKYANKSVVQPPESPWVYTINCNSVHADSDKFSFEPLNYEEWV